MTRTVWATSIAALVLVGCGASRPHAPPPAEAMMEGDVKAGYLAYRTFLTRWGSWEADPFHQVRWCPRPDQLRPSPEAFSPFAPVPPPEQSAASPSSGFQSDDAEAWHEVTTRSGRWLHEEEDGERWCWIPGLRPEAARIVLRAKMPQGPPIERGPSTGEKVEEAVEDTVEAAADAASVFGDLTKLIEKAVRKSSRATEPDDGER